MGKPRTALLILHAQPDSYRVRVKMPIEDARAISGIRKLEASPTGLPVEGGALHYDGRSLHWQSSSEATAERFIRRLIHHLHRYNMLLCERYDIHHSDLTRPACEPVLRRCFGEIRVSRRTREGGTWKSRGSYVLCRLI